MKFSAYAVGRAQGGEFGRSSSQESQALDFATPVEAAKAWFERLTSVQKKGCAEVIIHGSMWSPVAKRGTDYYDGPELSFIPAEGFRQLTIEEAASITGAFYVPKPAAAPAVQQKAPPAPPPPPVFVPSEVHRKVLQALAARNGRGSFKDPRTLAALRPLVDQGFLDMDGDTVTITSKGRAVVAPSVQQELAA